ncbi:nickase, partial [Lactococcus lactis subsp. lactis]|nr:nickase [Lactococcus lactis subsp. lactis]
LKGLPSENGDINREIKKYNQLLYKQEQLEKETEEKNRTNQFTRHFTPKEKRILSDLSKELNVFISFEKLEDKKRMLNNWKNSALAKQAVTNGQEQEPILSKIKDQKEAVEQAEILLNKEAQRFITAHYPKVNTNALSPYMARELVDKTIHNEQLFDLKETEQILLKSQHQELAHNLSLLLKDPYISVRVMKEKLNKQEAILKTFCAKYDIQLENKESVARQSDEVKKAFQGIIQPHARYKMAIKAINLYHETTIKEHLPMIDLKQLNGLQKEQLSNAILYFGDQLEEKVVIDVLNDRQPMKYDTATKERLLTGLVEEGHPHLTEIEKQFFENPSMKIMFVNECMGTKDFSKAGKQALKAVLDKNYTNVKDEIDKEKNVEEKDYYRNKTSNFSLLKGLGTNLLFTILRGESEPERPSHKPKKKKHKNDRGYSPKM